MEATETSEFPKYRDGDVIVVISSAKTYQLHSGILRRNSPVFAQLLTEQVAAQLCARARKEGVAIRYRVEMVQNNAGGVGVFELRAVDQNGRSAANSYFFPEIENGRVPSEQYRYWDWLFGSFYSRTPDFDDHNLATVLSGCMGLVDVAESIHAVDNVREHVDLALMRQRGVLWNSVASNPSAWAELGRRVHSPTIFTEGIVHMVGKWNNISDTTKEDLHPQIRALCEQKHKELDVAKEAIEMRILGHYPAFLCRNAVDRPGRPTYANDIYMWMAICFFRQWFAQAISDGRNRVSPDGGYEFYRQIGEGGQAYLNHESFRNFHQYFPMSSKACNVLEANMGVMKEDIKPFVRDLLIRRVTVDPSDYHLEWLTCTLITKEDFPWIAEEPETARDNEIADWATPNLPMRVSANGTWRRRSSENQLTSDGLGTDVNYRADDED